LAGAGSYNGLIKKILLSTVQNMQKLTMLN